MKTLLRKYFSLFLLTLFLFPQIEKSIHDFKHTNDFHCKASDKHFHQAQHDCPICEFTIPIVSVPVEENLDFNTLVLSSPILPYNEAKVIPQTHYFVSLRGPPIVS